RRDTRGLADERRISLGLLVGGGGRAADRDPSKRRAGTAIVGAVMGNFTLVDRFEDLDLLQNEWDELALHLDFVDVFSTAGFARAWWHAYGAGKVLRTVVARDETGGLRLIAPFWAGEGARGRWRLLGNVRADYNNVVFDRREPEILDAMMEWLLRRKDWQQI